MAAIEFAIMIPCLITFVVCAFDLGYGIYRNMQVQNSAQVGAQYAMIQTFDAAAIANAVTTATAYSGISASPAPRQYCGCADASGISPVSCGSTCPGSKIYGQYISVSATATYTPILPYPLVASSFTLLGQADVRVR